MSMLFIMRGVSGSGKSRLTEMCSHPHNVVSTDNLRMEMYGTYNMSPQHGKEIFPEAHRRLERRCCHRMFTIYDATNLTMRSINKVTRIAEKWGMPYRIISIDPDVEVIETTQNSRRRGTIEGAIVPDDMIEVMIERYETHTPNIKTKYGDKFFSGTASQCRDKMLSTLNELGEARNKSDNCFIIGDIHGCLSKLKELLAKIPQDAEIYSVGDVIDRGEDSVGCVLELNRDKRVKGVVMGNHEHQFIREIFDGMECRSNARRRTHEEYRELDDNPDVQEEFLSAILGYDSFIILESETSALHEKTLIITHGGIGSFDIFENNLIHHTGDRINPVDGSEIPQVHGHSSWKYTGDFSGTVVNVDSCCYGSGILTAFNPFTKEVIRVGD